MQQAVSKEGPKVIYQLDFSAAYGAWTLVPEDKRHVYRCRAYILFFILTTLASQLRFAVNRQITGMI